MKGSTLPFFAIGLSLATGASLGALTRRSPEPQSAAGPTQSPASPSPSTLPASGPGNASPSKPSTLNPGQATDPALPNASETQQFASMDLSKQQEMLERVSARFPNRRDTPPSLLLWIHRAVAQLSPDQAASLLEALASNDQKDGPSESALASRLAAADPQRALELGKKLSSSKITGAALASIAQKDGAEALRVIAQLPKELRNNALESYRKEKSTRVGGSFETLAQTLKQNPELLTAYQSHWEMCSLIGNSLGQLALTDPQTALNQVRDLASTLEAQSAQDGSESAGGRDGRRSRRGGGPHTTSPISSTVESALAEMRSTSVQAASAFFDSLSEKEKSPWMASREAVSRFSSGGIEAAVSFAEKQSSDESMRSAALGTWWSLAEKDIVTASKWIDSLPAGPFRQGVLTAVMLNAWNQSSSWGDTQTAIEAGQRLSSRNAQLDYFANLMTDRHGSPRNVAEMLQELPLTEPEKRQLIEKLAPIPAEPKTR
jgi:hypothetical protein